MYQVSLKPPADYYDDSIQELDQEILKLLSERKQRTQNNPGFPHKSILTKWAKDLQFEEAFLHSFFSNLFYEDEHKPIVEPKGFLKNVPVLKGVECKGVFHSITLIKQYKNASVLNLATDYNSDSQDHPFYELVIEGGETTYECQWRGGGGSGEHMNTSFVVIPALPDQETGLTLTFKEFRDMPKRFKPDSTFELTY
ncbi:hypothetical protein MKX54_01235 [Alkalihalobacillus sp. FSL R5-0424]